MAEPAAGEISAMALALENPKHIILLKESTYYFQDVYPAILSQENGSNPVESSKKMIIGISGRLSVYLWFGEAFSSSNKSGIVSILQNYLLRKRWHLVSLYNPRAKS